MLQALADPSLRIVGQVIKFLEQVKLDLFANLHMQLARTQPAALIARGDVIESQLQRLMNSADDDIRFRTFDAVVTIAIGSSETLTWTRERQLLTPLIQSFVTDDVLLQMNVIEILAKVCMKHIKELYVIICSTITDCYLWYS